ncbi:MAG: DUF881 domain-containing protein [Syntrophomonadaceae bacterium]
MRSKGAQVSIALVCIILGVMLSVQFKTTGYYRATLVPERTEDLAAQITTVKKEKEAMEQKVASLEEQIKNTKNNAQARADLQKELQGAKLSVGLLPVEGSGVKITLSDNPKALEPGEDPNDLLIHEDNLLMVVNDLKAAGAEAISINDQRITAMSEIRCAGTMIVVNQVRIGPPFVLLAIGNPDVLENSMTQKSGNLSAMQFMGIQASIEKSEKLRIPGFKGTVRMDYGKAVK